MMDPLQRFLILGGGFHEIISDVREYLRSIPTPEDEAGAIVRLVNIDHALDLYVEGVLSNSQLQEWADILEMNEHVRYESGAEEAVADFLFRLSTPEINEPITLAVVRKLRASLSGLPRLPP